MSAALPTFRTRAAVPAILTGLLALASCEGGLFAPDDESIRTSVEPPIRTTASVYALESNGFEWRTEIPFRYENRSGDPWFLVNCNGLYGYRLEKRVGDDWIPAYGPILPLCLSPAIRIEPGEALVDTIHVSAGFPGNNFHPKFEFTDPEGTYRIVLETRSSFDPDERGPPFFGPFLPLGQRLSNPFELRISDQPVGGS